MLPRVLALLTFLVILTSSRSTPLSTKEKSVTRDLDYRLPGNIVPEAYRIRITPLYPESENLLDSKTFSGVVVIDAQVLEATNKITLHKGPTIEEVSKLCVINKQDADDKDENEEAEEEEDDTPPNADSLCDESTDLLKIEGEIEEEEETEKFTITLKTGIPLNSKIRIVLQFSAEYPQGGLTGFYVSTFEIKDEYKPLEKHAMLTTKFEPTHARKAFPCFDEPAMKATFKLFIDLTDGIQAISNMKGASKDNLKVFEKSPKMSPYLLAFIVYEEDVFIPATENIWPGNDYTYNTWGTRDVIKNGGGLLSQVEGPAAIKFLEKFTGIKFTGTEEEPTMTKMDLAAIPDFQSRAMENWGLVTFRESALIYNKQTGTTENYKRIVEVIAHELSHMWFGNLVTTEWWSSIWLNEGFARYMQYLATHDRYPNWHMPERFILDEQMGALAVDADANSPPLTDDTVQSPTEIGNHFGTISYSKGGAILRQISNVMGIENFNKGVRKYLKENYLGSVTPTNLFDSLKKYHDKTISGLKNDDEFLEVLKHWTETPGYPLVTVTRKSNTFSISQERFLLEPGKESSDEKYPIYITWTTSKEENAAKAAIPPQKWLQNDPDSLEFDIEDIDYNDWVIFNVYQGGYYRVNYDDGMWTLLSNMLEGNEGANLDRVSAIDRAALVDNALALARAGAITYERALRLLRFLRHDAAFEPWAAARTALAHLQRMLGAQQPFKEFVAFIVENAYNATGFYDPMDAHIEKVHRSNILNIACSAGYEPCLEETKSMLKQYLPDSSNQNPVSVDPDLESVVFCYGLKGASSETWERLWAEYATSDAARRSTLITALGCIDHRTTLEDFLLKSIDSDQVRPQDAYTVFSSVYSNNDGGAQVALDFLTFRGYEKLDKSYGAVRNAMTTLMSGLADRLQTEKQKEQLEAALTHCESDDDNQDDDDEDDGEVCSLRHESAVKTVERNIEWKKTHEQNVLPTLDKVRTSTYSSAPQVFVSSTITVLWAALTVVVLR